MRIATWNVNSLNARMERVQQWIEYAQPDVLCMQETKMADEKFPAAAFLAMGYESAHCGNGRWNGVAILSRVGLEDPQFGFADVDEPLTEPRIVSATCGGIRVFSVYVPNGRALDDPHYQFKLDWFAKLQSDLENNFDPTLDIVIGGDYNVAPTDEDVWNPKKFVDATHVSQPERDAIQRLESWGLVDVFRQLHPEPQLYSWWDYRGGDFHKRQGLRIDLMMVSKSVAARTTMALIDRQARKGEKPSDHAPVIIDLDD